MTRHDPPRMVDESSDSETDRFESRLEDTELVDAVFRVFSNTLHAIEIMEREEMDRHREIRQMMLEDRQATRGAPPQDVSPLVLPRQFTANDNTMSSVRPPRIAKTKAIENIGKTFKRQRRF